MNRLSRKLCVFVCAAFILIGCATPGPKGFQPSKSEFDSQWVAISGGSIIGEKGGQPTLTVSITNKKNQPLWVKVNFDSPDPSQSCEATKEITPNASAMYACSQNEIVADVPYPISVATFSDQALTQSLEIKQTKMQFKAQDIAALKAWMTPPKLPATFSDIWYRTDEAQLLLAYKETGTLLVTKDKLQFKYDKGSFEIAISAIKKVVPKKLLVPDIINEWVVIEYQDSNKNGIIAFKSSPFFGKSSDEDIYSAIRWASKKK